MTTHKQFPMSFTGTGGEFFRIWIINIALTLITFGIYSAWAKVRTKRWFYGHSILDQQTFGYHATPMQILKGRIIAIAFLTVYFLSAEFAPVLSLFMIAIIYLAMPWVIVQSLKFNARNSSYRGIRFGFSGSLGESYINFLLFPLLIFVSLGIALPYVVYRQTKFVVNHYEYGQTVNQFRTTSGPFWKVYGVAFAFLMLPLLLMALGFSQAFQFIGTVSSADVFQTASGLMVFAVIAFYLSSFALAAYMKVRIANMVYNHSKMGTVSFVSTQRVRDVIWLYVSNLVLVAITFGLFIPWAKVRLVKYRAEHLQVESSESLEDFAAGNNQPVSASGDELADVLDMDFGLVG